MTRKYTPLWIEGLAYHEAGHAVMGLALNVQIARVEIAEACDKEATNGITECASLKNVSLLRLALFKLASDPAQRMAPNYDRFKTSRRFASGRRNDRNEAFQLYVPVYLFMDLAESTARAYFRTLTRPPLFQIMDQSENQKLVHEVAQFLIAHKRMDGETIMGFRNRTVLPADFISLEKHGRGW